MATTPENSQQDQEDFASAFNGEDPVKTEMSEDEAFGLTPEPMEDEATEESQAMADEPATEVSEDPVTDAGGETSPSIVIAVDPGAEDNANMDPKELQRQKSWEGRLKAREAELKAREDALSMHAAEGETPAEDAAEAPVTEAIEEAVAKVESGELTFEQAMSTLSNDFGPDFTKMLGVLIEAKASEIAGKTADERVSKVREEMDGLAGEIVADKSKAHYESISDAHPDFMEVADSPEFKAFVDTQGEDARTVIESGSARAINKLLSDFKGAGKQDAPQDSTQEDAMTAAEGVRSSGLKLPEKPTEAQDFAAAWDEF